MDVKSVLSGIIKVQQLILRKMDNLMVQNKYITNNQNVGSDYIRTVISSDSALQNRHWYICTQSNLNLQLPNGKTGNYIRISTTGVTTGITIIPTNNENIDGDIEGLIINKIASTVEFFWTGSNWTIIDVQ